MGSVPPKPILLPSSLLRIGVTALMYSWPRLPFPVHGICQTLGSRYTTVDHMAAYKLNEHQLGNCYGFAHGSNSVFKPIKFSLLRHYLFIVEMYCRTLTHKNIGADGV